MTLGALVALVVAALALPALAQHNGGFFGEDQGPFDEERFKARQDRIEDRWEERQERWEDRADEGFFGANGFDRFADFSGFDAQDWWNDDDWNNNRWRDDRNNDNNNAPAVSQSSEQNASSGNVNQSFNVSGGGGNNSNQCVGVQGVANTGNAQNQISVLQYASEADDFSFEDSAGASINVSPTNATRCDQQVNQAASASFGR